MIIQLLLNDLPSPVCVLADEDNVDNVSLTSVLVKPSGDVLVKSIVGLTVPVDKTVLVNRFQVVCSPVLVNCVVVVIVVSGSAVATKNER